MRFPVAPENNESCAKNLKGLSLNQHRLDIAGFMGLKSHCLNNSTVIFILS